MSSCLGPKFLNFRSVMPTLGSVDYMNPEQIKGYIGSQFLSSGPVKCFHINSRSICNKYDEFTVLVNRFGFCFDVIMISETWYADDSVFTLPMYQTYLLTVRVDVEAVVSRCLLVLISNVT